MSSFQHIFQEGSQQNMVLSSLKQHTPQRSIYTSQSKRSYRPSSIPKYLQSELLRQGQKETFLTEISTNIDQNSQNNASYSLNQNNYSQRNISTAASGSFRNKILRSRKPIDFAIKTNSSSRLEQFFNSMNNQNDQNKKEEDISELDNYKQKIMITIPKSPKRNIEHGFVRKDTYRKSKIQLNFAQTLSHIPALLDELDQIEKQEDFPDEVQLLRNEVRLRKVVKKIDYSKQVNQLAPMFQSKIFESRKQDNQLNFMLQKSTSKLNLLRLQENKINNPLVNQEIKHLKETIVDLERQIEDYQNQIHDQEMHLISKQHMKEVRYKDMIQKREDNLNLQKITSHLIRFLQRETDSLYIDSKNLDSIFNKTVEERYNKEQQLNRQSIMTRDMENKKSNEEEVDRLIDLEIKMREYERKDIYTKKRDEYLQQKIIENKDIENIFKQQNEYSGIIKDLECQFVQFHQKNKVASSYSDLLQFCVHVKQSTLNLRHEKEIFQQNADILRLEVKELEQQLKQYELQNPFDFEMEQNIESVQIKKDCIMNQQIELFLKQSKQQNYSVLSIDQIEKDNFQLIQLSEATKNKENLTHETVFKSIHGLKDLHNLFFTKLNNIPFDTKVIQKTKDLIKLKKKQFSIDQLESSIQQFSNSINSLRKIINEKKGGGEEKKEDQSINIAEMSDDSENQQQQKYYYTYVDL